ncbi:hypothetical protein FHS18_005273 [Paenibacillus phyllosphaerae]|uniref:Sporulation inhibitor A n=1 Tax=Paenibacillus phyllosphaerae TaxID=274593 RepID=A0A7W5FQ78_9BACL|nr:sporulation histidine kinase inhibitor Sda [Paenibacillus phyllosphaerae]MBB3113170.1 hypothetical protein [Paenibacillus phyllosphaerae]
MNRSQSTANAHNFIEHESENSLYGEYPSGFGASFARESDDAPQEKMNVYLPMQDKSLLLRPLSDTHLLEVYHEAKAMRLSSEFIALIEQAIVQRGIQLKDDL